MNLRMKIVFTKTVDGIAKMLERPDAGWNGALETLSACRGKVVFMGVGKSGHIGQKLAATFSSTGTPSFFVHSTEAMHGDLGMIEARDVAILISNSGSTREVIQTLPALKKIGCKTVAFTSAADSALAKECDCVLLYPKCEEADRLGLAPTVSSTLTLVLGDALACALSERKNFSRADFYAFHPGGALGQMLAEEKTEGKGHV